MDLCVPLANWAVSLFKVKTTFRHLADKLAVGFKDLFNLFAAKLALATPMKYESRPLLAFEKGQLRVGCRYRRNGRSHTSYRSHSPVS
jgi:hypothetical protein